eukprot:CAMPEP_0177677232 /NCGR_PEP_ID=MMETSP0447-20121125/28264_1 /TAXON_ID=0 /ORGANISM="Stygamoeba regulata, Strain BSH-02190019" /LENGTH=535 /DNA_ID=CAMNT_0019185951 /DNA_START=66 /DNA_END=1673 /DNA_ORIENTATION=-
MYCSPSKPHLRLSALVLLVLLCAAAVVELVHSAQTPQTSRLPGESFRDWARRREQIASQTLQDADNTASSTVSPNAAPASRSSSSSSSPSTASSTSASDASPSPPRNRYANVLAADAADEAAEFEQMVKPGTGDGWIPPSTVSPELERLQMVGRVSHLLSYELADHRLHHAAFVQRHGESGGAGAQHACRLLNGKQDRSRPRPEKGRVGRGGVQLVASAEEARQLEEAGVLFAPGISGVLQLCVTGQQASLVGFLRRTDAQPLLFTPMTMNHRLVTMLPALRDRSLEVDLLQLAPWLLPASEHTVYVNDGGIPGSMTVKADGWLHMNIGLSHICTYTGDHVHVDLRWLFGLEPAFTAGQLLPMGGSQMVRIQGQEDAFAHDLSALVEQNVKSRNDISSCQHSFEIYTENRVNRIRSIWEDYDQHLDNHPIPDREAAARNPFRRRAGQPKPQQSRRQQQQQLQQQQPQPQQTESASSSSSSLPSSRRRSRHSIQAEQDQQQQQYHQRRRQQQQQQEAQQPQENRHNRYVASHDDIV